MILHSNNAHLRKLVHKLNKKTGVFMNYFLHRQDNEYGRCDGILHEIKKNDTLYRLSRLYGVKISDLLEKNPNVDVYNLKIGDKLCIPIEHMPYIVKTGDTLDWLLEHFGLNYNEFRDANPQLQPFILPENEVIYIPNRKNDAQAFAGSVS